GIAVSVNVANTVDTEATVGTGATLSAGGKATVHADASFVPVQDTIKFNLNGKSLVDTSIGITSFAAGAAGSAGSGVAVGGSSSVHVILVTTTASGGAHCTVSGASWRRGDSHGHGDAVAA